jgi:hypothetical protein
MKLFGSAALFVVGVTLIGIGMDHESATIGALGIALTIVGLVLAASCTPNR